MATSFINFDTKHTVSKSNKIADIYDGENIDYVLSFNSSTSKQINSNLSFIYLLIL